MSRRINRRRFLAEASCGAMSATTLINSMVNLGAINGATTGNSANFGVGSDYKALVCLLLQGGCDTFNVLIPMGMDASAGGDNGYLKYSETRSDLAIPLNQVLPLNPLSTTSNGLTSRYDAYGLHPGMPEIQNLFNTGACSFISNIGTLVEPLADYNDYYGGVKKLPLGVYSHSDQVMQWQSSVPQSRDALGFGGRVADLLHAQNDFDAISMNISLAGSNTFQTGHQVVEYAVSDNLSPDNVGFESIKPWWYSNTGFLTQTRNNAIDNLVSQTYANLLKQQYSSLTKTSIESFELFKEALKKVPSFTTVFPNTGLADDLFAIAKLISVQAELGAKRQIFFVQYGGWDNHDDLIQAQAQRLPVVSQALNAFYNATVELGIQDKVTTFTISDFARTATSNGQGSDHAWGGNHIVMGGAVDGQRIFGGYPSMDINNPAESPLNVSFRGNFIPSISTDQFYAELALWYGVSVNDLCYVLPNLGNFYSYSNGVYPIGFMDFSGTSICTNPAQESCLVY